jgi:hypothetical protein
MKLALHVTVLTIVLQLQGMQAFGESDQGLYQDKLDVMNAGLNNDSIDSKEDKKIDYKFSGRIHRTNMIVEDGISTNMFFMDSDQAPTMLRLQVSSSPRRKVSVSGNLELAIQSNRPMLVNQNNPNPGTIVRVQASEVTIKHNNFGSLDIGTGLVSSAVIIEYDLSGTSKSSMVLTGLLAPGMLFGDKESGTLSDVKVSDYFFSPERLLISDRVRYRSPLILKGFQISGSYASDRRWDASIRYFRTFEQWKLQSFVSIENRPTQIFEDRYVLGASLKHLVSGFSLTGLYTIADLLEEDWNAKGFSLKIGHEKKYISQGTTSFSLDFGKGYDITTLGEYTTNFGAFAQQKFDSINLDLYLGYRRYSISSTSDDLHPLQTYTLGMLFNF